MTREVYIDRSDIEKNIHKNILFQDDKTHIHIIIKNYAYFFVRLHR